MKNELDDWNGLNLFAGLVMHTSVYSNAQIAQNAQMLQPRPNGAGKGLGGSHLMMMIIPGPRRTFASEAASTEHLTPGSNPITGPATNEPEPDELP